MLTYPASWEDFGACDACGHVLSGSDSALLAELTWCPRGHGPLGQHLRPGEDGTTATHIVPPQHRVLSSTPGQAAQRTQAKVRKRLAQLAPLLNLPSAVTITAEGLAARAAKLHIRGLTSGAGLAALVYAACRLEAQPLSIATVAGAAGSDPTRVGHSFLALSRALELQPPPISPTSLTLTALDRLAAARRGDAGRPLPADTLGTLRRDVTRLLPWLDAQVPTGCRPGLEAGVALFLAASMAQLDVRVEEVASAAGVGAGPLLKRLGVVQGHVHLLAQRMLPYASSVAPAGVASHLRTLMRLTAAMESAGGEGQAA
ncbi:hypothetical protein ACKKBG_A34995 [Auxenochlorella protothecoides x Auxenochlorella symbiontica]